MSKYQVNPLGFGVNLFPHDAIGCNGVSTYPFRFLLVFEPLRSW